MKSAVGKPNPKGLPADLRQSILWRAFAATAKRLPNRQRVRKEP